MSLSAEKIKEYQVRWIKLIDPILTDLLYSPEDVFLNNQICSTFWAGMCELRLGTMLEELADGYDIFIQDEWSVELPKLLIELDDYSGDVVIDLAGARTFVSLEKFCLVAKFAAVFYSKFLDRDFDEWGYFTKIDHMCEKFRVAQNQ